MPSATSVAPRPELLADAVASVTGGVTLALPPAGSGLLLTCMRSPRIVPRSPHMAKVLVIDDEANLRKVLAALLRRDGYDVTIAKVGGMEVLKGINGADPEVPVIIITAHGTVDSAVEAIKLGAFDYVTKPFDQTELSNVLAKAIRTHESAQRNARDERGRPSLVGESPQMQDVMRIIDKVADTPSTVLITGESGTGKELVATALHEGSSRRENPFIRINCAAIPRELIESELFGYERGA